MAAYLVGHIKVKDQDLWQVYTTGVQKSLVPFTAEVVFRGQRAAILAGEHSFDQCVVIKFESQAALQEWYNSEAYQGLIPTREQAADVVIISFES